MQFVIFLGSFTENRGSPIVFFWGFERILRDSPHKRFFEIDSAWLRRREVRLQQRPQTRNVNKKNQVHVRASQKRLLKVRRVRLQRVRLQWSVTWSRRLNHKEEGPHPVPSKVLKQHYAYFCGHQAWFTSSRARCQNRCKPKLRVWRLRYRENPVWLHSHRLRERWQKPCDSSPNERHSGALEDNLHQPARKQRPGYGVPSSGRCRIPGGPSSSQATWPSVDEANEGCYGHAQEAFGGIRCGRRLRDHPKIQ